MYTDSEWFCASGDYRWHNHVCDGGRPAVYWIHTGDVVNARGVLELEIGQKRR